MAWPHRPPLFVLQFQGANAPPTLYEGEQTGPSLLRRLLRQKRQDRSRSPGIGYSAASRWTNLAKCFSLSNGEDSAEMSRRQNKQRLHRKKCAHALIPGSWPLASRQLDCLPARPGCQRSINHARDVVANETYRAIGQGELNATGACAQLFSSHRAASTSSSMKVSLVPSLIRGRESMPPRLATPTCS